MATLPKPPPLSGIRNAGDFAAWLFHFCGSLRLTIVLMLYIAVACVFGTFFEGRHGTKAAQASIYKAWWFDIGLGLMATNITCSALRRWPFQGKHTGFLITHLGILTILFGAFLTHRYGIEGQVAILEGESEARLFQDQNILTISTRPGEIASSFVTDFENRPWDHAPKTEFTAKDLGVSIVVDQYFPNASYREVVSEDGTAENPAVRIALHGGRMTGNSTSAHWLVARDPERRALDFGMMSISLEEAASADAVDAIVLSLEEERPSPAPPAEPTIPNRGVLRFKISEPGVEADLTVDVEKTIAENEFGTKIPVGESGVFVRLVKYFPAFVIDKDPAGNMVPTNKTDDPINPAIEFEVGRGDEVVDRRYKFLFYDFDIRPPQIPLEVTWDAPELRGGGQPPADPHGGALAKALRLFSLPDGEIRYVSTVSEPRKSGVLKPGETVELSAKVGIAAELVSATRRARLVEEVVNDGNEVKRSAVKVRVRKDKAEETAWIPNQDVAPIRIGSSVYYVGYGSRSIPLPFRIHLVDFKEKRYPHGTGQSPMSAEFSSRVILDDPERGVFREHLISMNNVLDWRGFRFFQSSFSRPPGAAPDSVRETSVFAVNKDPGKTIVYVGFTVLVCGIFTLFYIQPSIRKRRAIRPAPRGSLPAASAA